MTSKVTLSVLTCLVFCAVRPLQASQLWGAYSGAAATINLFPIDAETGVLASPKSIGSGLMGTAVADLASDPIRRPSVVWAVRRSGAGNELISVDVSQESMLSYTLLNAPSSILSLAIDPTDGAFYGATTAALYRIAPGTGMTTLIGATALPVDKALGFDLQGNLYGISAENDLVAVDKSSAVTSLVAPLNLLRMEDIAARPEDGAMFGLGYADYSLFRINLQTGQLTNVGPSLVRPSGLAFTNVPEPTAALLYMVALGALTARRER